MGYYNGQKIPGTAHISVIDPIVMQEVGDSPAHVMSQKATTDAINKPPYFITRKVLSIYDNDNPTIANGYTNSNGFVATDTHKTLQIAVEPNSIYCISRAEKKGRLSLDCFCSEITSSALLDKSAEYSTEIDFGNGDYRLVKTGNTTAYLGIYYYNSADGIAEDEIRNLIRVDVGFSPSCGTFYVPTKDVDVNSVYYTDKKTIYVGNELLSSETSITLNSGWSGNFADGFTCAKNYSGKKLYFYPNLKKDAVYILEFDTDYTGGEFVKVYIENNTPTLVYNGGTHIIVPIKAVDDNPKMLIFESCTDVGFTISNISCKKVELSGTPLDLIINTTANINNPNNLGFWNVILGKNAMTGAVGSTRTIVIGNNALANLQNGHRNIGVGTFAMSQMRYGEGNISIGADSMLAMQEAHDNVAIGQGALYKGENTENNVAIGRNALFGTDDSTAFYNVAIGTNAGVKFKKHRLTAVGYGAGYNESEGYGNTLIGFNTEGQPSGYDNTAVGKQANYSNGVYNSTAIGANAKCTKPNQVVLGDRNVERLVVGNKNIIFNDDGTVTWEPVTE